VHQVGSELESLLGSGFYWALLCLSVVAGGFADAALSPEVRGWRGAGGLCLHWGGGGCCCLWWRGCGVLLVGR